ncbi:ester hydrolase C11orf54 homolog [Hyalella azteca]|uniref:Ester hydrolase C11orf54 homolog n=2 Tax=Hyalella azteca TaxID=294128 RepID=A0A8B7N282_HYAAZ|nr:ester hydrolase C11orf54 homolog [Hyalella azteca]
MLSVISYFSDIKIKMSWPVESVRLFTSPLEDICSILRKGLEKNFKEVSVSVEECPDLTKAPFNLPAAGLAGSTRIADVGGPPYLVPFADLSKNYDFNELAKLIDLPDSFIVGAGGGPHEIVGMNSEMMPNLRTGTNADNNSKVSKLSGDGHELVSLAKDQACCSLMVNLFACEGAPGKVLKVRARQRIGEENFVSCIRKAITEGFPNKVVGLGGIFRMLSGAAKCHIMPNFSKIALNNDEEVSNWLKYFEMAAPMIFFSVMVSSDPGLDLRLEHSHGYGAEYGGHYHYDVTPDTVEYEAYYNLAEVLYRVDKPQNTHNIGKN